MKKTILFLFMINVGIALMAQSNVPIVELINSFRENKPNDHMFHYKESISNYGKLKREVRIVGTHYAFEPLRDTLGNIIESSLNPDSFSEKDKEEWNKWLKYSQTQNKILHALEQSRPFCNESYWWEKHQNSKDSVMISMAFRNRFDHESTPEVCRRTASSKEYHYSSNEYIEYYTIPYETPTPLLWQRLTWRGIYYLSYVCSIDTTASGVEPFDGKAYEEFLQPLLAEQRITRQSFQWKYDRRANDVPQLSAGILSNSDSCEIGTATGTLYTLPMKDLKKDSAEWDAFRLRLSKYTEDYLASHPSQRYYYTPNVDIDTLNTAPVYYLWDYDNHPLYFAKSRFMVGIGYDKEGIHILFLHNDGENWTPHHYSVLQNICRKQKKSSVSKRKRKR